MHAGVIHFQDWPGAHTKVNGESICCSGAVKQQFSWASGSYANHSLHFTISHPELNSGSFLWSEEFHKLPRLWLQCGGVGWGSACVSLSQGAARRIFLTEGGGVESYAQLRKLPESTHRPTSKQPDVGFTIQSLLSPPHFSWPRKRLPWLGSKKRSKLPFTHTHTHSRYARREQTARQTKPTELLINTFGTGNRSHMIQLSLCQSTTTVLIDANECQIWM